MTTEPATLAGGCFWCLEAIFNDLDGVLKVTSGYSGGTVSNPTYKQVCTGITGHAEVIQIKFNHDIISYETLLNIFFKVHDPTTLNRQGADVGTQYRSAIFYHNRDQKEIAEKVISENQANFANPILTEIESFKEFYPAEEYHHDYYQNNPQQPYCRMVIAPKLAKFKKDKANLISNKDDG